MKSRLLLLKVVASVSQGWLLVALKFIYDYS